MKDQSQLSKKVLEACKDTNPLRAGWRFEIAGWWAHDQVGDVAKKGKFWTCYVRGVVGPVRRVKTRTEAMEWLEARYNEKNPAAAPDPIIDLRKCQPMDVLISCHGDNITYIGSSAVPQYPHRVRFSEVPKSCPGAVRLEGTRCDNGNVFANGRLESDHDIVKVIRAGRVIQEAARIPITRGIAGKAPK